METNFELKKVTSDSEEDENKFILDFSDGKELKSVVLQGSGKIKETASV